MLRFILLSLKYHRLFFVFILYIHHALFISNLSLSAIIAINSELVGFPFEFAIV